MPAAPVPPPFERLEGRRFAFHPPIGKVASNEWIFRCATWSEIVVRNVATGRDLSVPRRFLSEASPVDRPARIVALREQLEYQAAEVRPARKRVIEMPRAEQSSVALEKRVGVAPVIGIRLEPRRESKASRLAGGAVALGVMGCLALVGYSLEGERPHRRAIVTSVGQTYLLLTANDSYQSVVKHLGVPNGDQRVIVPSGDRLHLLNFSDRGFRAVLKTTGASEYYVGSVDSGGRALHTVLLPSGVLSSELLHQLQDF